MEAIEFGQNLGQANIAAEASLEAEREAAEQEAEENKRRWEEEEESISEGK